MAITKISDKITIIFGIFILVIIANVVFYKQVIKEVNESYNYISSELEPIIKDFNQLKALNTELLILCKNKLRTKSSIDALNRTKAITEVDFPNIYTDFILQAEKLDPDDNRRIILESLSANIKESIKIVEHFNKILYSKKDFEDSTKIEEGRTLIFSSLNRVSFNIKNQIDEGQYLYEKASTIEKETLLSKLSFFANIVIIAGVIAILSRLVFAFRFIHGLINPIKKIDIAAKNISKGEFTTINIKGNDEIASLGKSFNEMSKSLESSFRQIEENNEELEQFVYITTHDLQEPLRTINSFSELLLKKHDDSLDERVKQSLIYIDQASKRMSNLVFALLEYGRVGRDAELKEIDCNKLIDEITNDLKLKIEENEVELSVEKMPIINGYEVELRMLFQNLIINGIKYRSLDRKPKISIGVTEYRNYWKIKVSDNGIGIEKNFYDKIFQMFQRLHTREEIDGTGIGLSQCKKIANLHNGEIWVESEVGKGSDFYITISRSINHSNHQKVKRQLI